MTKKTELQYAEIVTDCRQIFEKKNQDYGQSWRIMRVSSVVDQILIKAVRIRTIEESGKNYVGEDIESEFKGIINYCVMGLIQLETGEDERYECPTNQLMEVYDRHLETAKNLMLVKNKDYGEIWRDMLVSTFTDMLLMRVNRIRQILFNDGKTQISEGVESNFLDMINYSVFALIQLTEKKH